MRIGWSRRARRDLDWIEDYIAADDPYAALQTRDRIEHQVKHLKMHPRLGRKGRVRGTRELVIAGSPYIAIYRPKKYIVEMVRILHGAQQWPPSGSHAR